MGKNRSREDAHFSLSSNGSGLSTRRLKIVGLGTQNSREKPYSYFGNSSGGPVLIPNVEGSPQAISGFHFDFKHDDHHLSTIACGYTPNYEQWEHFILLDFEDQNGDDDFGYQFTQTPLPTEGIRPGCYMDSAGPHVKADGVPVLTGFKLHFAGVEDHHFARIKVSPTPVDGYYPTCQVALHDKNGSPPSGSIGVIFLKKEFIRDIVAVGDSCSGGSCTVPVNFTNPVLQGFEIAYHNGDHHIDELGIIVSQTSITVKCNDKNDDDAFYWEVTIVDLI